MGGGHITILEGGSIVCLCELAWEAIEALCVCAQVGLLTFPPPLLSPSSPMRTQVGDQILEVNGRSFLSIPHDEAVQVLKTSRHLMMMVKDVGRLPHARTIVDETRWIPSSQIAESSASTISG